MQSVTSAEAASQLAVIPVRLPTAAQDQAGLVVQPASHATFKIETKRIQAILDEIGRSDIQLPAGLDGSSVEMDVPAAVAALYGPCQAELAAAQKQELKPSQVDEPKVAAAALMSRSSQRYIHRDHALRDKSPIDPHQMEKGAPHRKRRSQKHDGEHHLRRNQRFANQPRAAIAAGAARRR